MALALAPTDSVDLWVADSQGSSGIVATDGRTAVDIAIQTGSRAVAVDAERGTVWSVSAQAVLMHDQAGALLRRMELGGDSGEPSALEVDPQAGSVWVVTQSLIRGFDATGQALFLRRLSQPISAATADGIRGRLWFAVNNDLSAIDPAGHDVTSVRLGDVRAIQALAYASALDQLWVVADGTLRRFDAGAMLTGTVVALPELKKIAAVDSDGGTGLWAAIGSQLLRIDSNGTVLLRVRPFASGANALVDVVGDGSDGSAWVAAQHRLSHVGADGTVLAEITHDGANSAAHVVRSLFLRSGAPRIEFVSPANGAFLPTAIPPFVLRLGGARIDLTSLEFLLDGTPRQMTCSTTTQSASCSPTQAITDGVHRLEASVANTSGQRSRTASLSFAIDTLAPTITLSTPIEGLLTNGSTVAVSGRVSEGATVDVGGTGVALDASLQFARSGVPLSEGTNTIIVTAVDRAGNSSNRSVHVTRDSTPPAAPAGGRINAQIGASGLARVIGSIGSVEADALVALVDTRTGTSVTVRAAADGSFAADIVAQTGDSLRVTAADAAGNTSAVTSVAVQSAPGFEPLQLTILSPTSGQSVQGDLVLVTLSLQGPINTGVVVDGHAADAIRDGSGLRLYAVVPLQAGSNTVTAVATTPDGRTDTRSITLTRTRGSDYQITATPAGDVAPVDVRLEIADPNSLGVRQVAIDTDANGTIDVNTTTPLEPIHFTYQGPPGLRQAVVYVVDTAGTVHPQTVYVVVLDPAQLDRSIRTSWAEMVAALQAGDRDRALRTIVFESQRTYGPVFEALMPYMSEVFGDTTDIQKMNLRGGFASYCVLNIGKADPSLHVVNFIRSTDGVWRIVSL